MKAWEVVLFVVVAALLLLGIAAGMSFALFIIGTIFFPTLDYGATLAVTMVLFAAIFWFADTGLVGLAGSIVSSAIVGGVFWAFGTYILHADTSFFGGMFVWGWAFGTAAMLFGFIKAESKDELEVLRGNQ